MQLGAMISGEYLCVRANKITKAMQPDGWEHEALCRRMPSHYLDAYHTLKHNSFRDKPDFYPLISESPAKILHVHNEPNWPVSVAKEVANGRPVILNVHDITTGRPGSTYDYAEEQAYKDADALIFTAEHQRDYAKKLGFDIDKPTVILPNYAPRDMIVTKPYFPHIGGICYVGGAEPRGKKDSWRDMSPVADVLDGELHMYPGNNGVEYGLVHITEYDLTILAHRLARHDWGFCGVPVPNSAWDSTLPNKLFEYLAAGLPVIVLNSAPSAEFVEKHGVGIVLDSIMDLKRLKKVSKLHYNQMKASVRATREQFTMERNIGPVVDLYERLLSV